LQLPKVEHSSARRKYIVEPIALSFGVRDPRIMPASVDSLCDSPVSLGDARSNGSRLSTCGLITYRGQLVAIAAPQRVLLMPPISAMESDHPHRRFVATLALVWREMRCGAQPEPYDADVAQFYARWILMPNDDFARLSSGKNDAELAEFFNVPVEQVAAKREDLRVAIRSHTSLPAPPSAAGATAGRHADSIS
jgi:hypothetical protein